MDSRAQELLEKYLDEIEEELETVSRSQRREIVTEIRSHLLAQWEDTYEKNGAAMLNILDQFGDPREIAGDYVGKTETRTPASPSATFPVPAVLIVLLTVFLWPVGIVLAWMSPFWRTKHKTVATVLPLLALVGIVLFMLPARVYMSSQVEYSTEIVENVMIDGEVSTIGGPGQIVIRGSRQPGRFFSVLIGFLGVAFILVCNPLGSGLYLAVTVDKNVLN